MARTALQTRLLLLHLYGNIKKRLVASNIPQGSVLGFSFLNTFVSNIGEALVGKIWLFANDAKMYRVDIPGCLKIIFACKTIETAIQFFQI